MTSQTKTYEVYVPKDPERPAGLSHCVHRTPFLKTAKEVAESEMAWLPSDARYHVTVYGNGRKYWIDAKKGKWVSVQT